MFVYTERRALPNGIETDAWIPDHVVVYAVRLAANRRSKNSERRPISKDRISSGATGPAADVAVTNTDNDTAASLQADLVVTINDNVTEVHSGQSLSYTVVVTNNGPSASLGATVSIGSVGAAPGAWTCIASTGSSCTASGSGAVSTSLNLLANGVATFHLAATVNDPAPESVTTTATVTMPSGGAT
mgnify:CR=1 FL=1